MVFDVAEKVHNRNVEVASAAVKKAFDVAQSLRDKAPQVPEPVSGPVQKVTAPVTQVLGSPAELVAYIARSGQDWLEVQNRLQSGVVAVATGLISTIPGWLAALGAAMPTAPALGGLIIPNGAAAAGLIVWGVLSIGAATLAVTARRTTSTKAVLAAA